MKDFKSIIKKIGICLIILSILLGLLDLGLFFIVNTNDDIIGLTKKPCEINNASDVSKCEKENKHVKVNFTKAYETTYVYQENNVTKAYYLDLDLNGKSFIALIDKNTATKLLNGEQKYVEGNLTTFTEVDAEALRNIKTYYISEGITADYVTLQLTNYKTGEIYIGVILLIAFTAFVLYNFMKGILWVIKPENYHYYKLNKEEIDKIDAEINSEYRYAKKGIKVSKNYLFYETKCCIKVYPLSSIKWVYQKDFRRYGATVNRMIVINFVDGKSLTIPIKQKDVIDQFGKDILIGYTNENIKEYRNIVNEYKKNHK